MAKVIRIGGVNIPTHKHIVIALATSIFGIGPTRSKKICITIGVDPATKVRDLSEAVLDAIRTEVGKYKIEGELRREIATNIRRLELIKCYRGMRHLRKLPVRGQRTRTNARTRKGVRRAIRKN
jgi:small subunit ribosomal protein S13